MKVAVSQDFRNEDKAACEALRPVDAEMPQVLVSNHRRFHAYLVKRLGSDTLAENRKHVGYLRNLDVEGRTQERAPDDLEAAVCECMKALLPTLKTEYAEVIRRVDLEGMSVPEVAQELGATENNLRVRLSRARQALKTSLVRTCGTCTEHGCLDCTCS